MFPWPYLRPSKRALQNFCKTETRKENYTEIMYSFSKHHDYRFTVTCESRCQKLWQSTGTTAYMNCPLLNLHVLMESFDGNNGIHLISVVSTTRLTESWMIICAWLFYHLNTSAPVNHEPIDLQSFSWPDTVRDLFKIFKKFRYFICLTIYGGGKILVHWMSTIYSRLRTSNTSFCPIVPRYLVDKIC